MLRVSSPLHMKAKSSDSWGGWEIGLTPPMRLGGVQRPSIQQSGRGKENEVERVESHFRALHF